MKAWTAPPEKRDRYIAYLDRAPLSRPLFGCTLGMFANRHYPLTMAALPDGPLSPGDIDTKLFLDDCEALYRAHCELDDDFPFACAALTAIPWMEAIVGCPIKARPGSVWAEHIAHSVEELDLDSFDAATNPWLLRLVELTRAAAEAADGRYPVGVTLMRGPADIMAAMLGVSEFVLECVDNPDGVKAAIEKLADIYITVAKAQFDALPAGGEYMCGDQGMRVWMPERYIWLQEDAMALLSPSLYRELVYDADCRIAHTFGKMAFHLHATALWAIDEILRIPDLAVLELNRESATFDEEGTFAGWAKIRAQKPLVIWAQYDDAFEDWVGRLLRELPPDGVNLQIALEERCAGKGRKVRESFEEICRRVCGK